MPVPSTPRRSTRGQIFTPSPHVAPSLQPKNVIFGWTSAPLPPSSSLPAELDPEGKRTYYNSFTRITSSTRRAQPLLTPGKRVKAGQGDEEARFSVGDGVLVKVEGGVDGVGVLVRLWEEPDDEVEEDDEEDKDGQDDDDAKGGDADGRANGEGSRSGPGNDINGNGTTRTRSKTRMMAEIHWCFRRKDLPGIMKNLSVEDNEVLLATSPIRPVTTSLPLALLIKTVPIYSLPFFTEQFAPKKSVVKGWQYVRTGIYWCARAFDKGAKGGKVFKVDIDEWREGGKAGQGWTMNIQPEVADEPPVMNGEGSDSERSGSEAGAGSESDESGSEGEAEVDGIAATSKRKRKAGNTGRKKPPKKAKIAKGPVKKTKKVPHPKSSTSYLPLSVLSPAELPKDPYERALRLLHVGATPESLPCREEEFVDVLSKVEEGVETGGGGCLYIAGVPGTGKTATVHAVVKELKRKAEDGELPPFSYVEINGLKIPSPQHAYTVLWEAISGAKGVSSKTALRGLESHFSKKTMGVRGPRNNTYVVLMDELDQLLTAKQDVVYNFFNWPTMRDSQLFVIAVANRMDLPQHLAAKIKSRLGLQTLLFQPYDRQSLIEIVQSRLIPHPDSQAEHKVLQPDAIALAATKMAGTNGDARRVLDACRRAVEVAQEPKDGKVEPHPVTAKEMMVVLNLMSSSPVALFLKQCSVQQKMMMAAMVRCVRREGVPEIPWRAIRTDHDALTRSLQDSNDLLSTSELSLIFSSLLATHALTWAYDLKQSYDERKIALGMEIGEVGRVLMNEGDAWRRALAGT